MKKNLSVPKQTMNMFSEKRKSVLSVLFILLVIGLTFLVFNKTRSSDFIYNWDDNINVTNNDHIRDWSREGLLHLFDPDTPVNEPRLTLFTYTWEYHEFSLNPAPYHLHNLLLHILNLMLLFFFVKKILKKNYLALLVIFIFAVHPLHVEPVAWITGRKDLLFSFFYLGSLLCYIRYIEKQKNNLWFFASLLFAFLGLLSKIQAMSIPLAWIALDVYFKRPLTIKSLFEKFLVVVVMMYNYFSLQQTVLVFLVYILIYYYHQIVDFNFVRKFRDRLFNKARGNGPLIWGLLKTIILMFVFLRINMWKDELIDRQNWLLSSFETAGLMALYFISPYRNKKILRNVDFNKPKIRIILLLSVIVTAAILVASFVPRLFFWTGDFALDFSFADRLFMGCYALMYYLVHFIVPFNNSPIQPYPSDAGLLPLPYYLSAMAVVALGLIFAFLLIKRKLRYATPFAFGVAFFLINVLMVLHLVSIEGRVIVADRYAYLAIAGLLMAVVALADGWLCEKQLRVKRIALSVAIATGLLLSVISYFRTDLWKNGLNLFTEVIRHYPDYQLAYINRGTLYLNSQQNHKAIADFDHAVLLDSTEEITYYNRALAYYNLEDLQKAYLDCSRTISRAPLFFDAWYLRAYIKNQSGNYAGAIADYNCTLRIKPDHKLALYNRGNTRKNLFDFEGALRDYQDCINIDPQFHMAYNGKGVALYFLGDYEASVLSFDEAIKKKPGEGNYFFNRALSKLKLNLTEEACRDFKTSWGLGYPVSQELMNDHCR